MIQALLGRLQKSAREIDRKVYDYAKLIDICKEKNFEDVYYDKPDSVDFEMI